MPISDNIKQIINTHLQNKSLTGLEGIYQINLLDTQEHYYVEVLADNYELHVTAHPNPTIELSTDKQILLDLIAGKVNPIQAMMSGQIQFSGDMSKAMQLKQLFT